MDRRITTRSLYTMGAPFIIVALFGWLNGYGNNYLIAYLFASTEVARFTFCLTISSMLQLVAAALNQVWSPRFYQITHTQPMETVEQKNRRFYGIQALAIGSAGGLIVAAFPTAMRVAGGNLRAYEHMGLELALLLGYYVLAVPVWHCQNYFMAYGKGTEFMNMTLITGSFGLVVWLLLMRLLGPVGIYVGFIAQVALRLVGSVIVARRRWPVKIAWEGVVAGLILVCGGYLVARR